MGRGVKAPLAALVWQAWHVIWRCAPVSGKSVREWINSAFTCLKDCVVWHSEQASSMCPSCTST